jgi:hypothetical protein
MRANRAILRRTPTRSLIALLVIAISILVLAARPPTPSDALRAQGPNGFPVPTCAYDAYNVHLDKTPPIEDDSYFIGSTIEVDAVANYVQEVPNGVGCGPAIQDVPFVTWGNLAVTGRPPGSSATLTTTGKFVAKLKPDVVGQYVVTFTACPNHCTMVFPPNAAVDVPPYPQTAIINAVDSLPIPPQTKPMVADLQGCQSGLPAFNVLSPGNSYDPCKSSDFTTLQCADVPVPPPFPQCYNHDELVCNGGGGVINPEWVTVLPWHSAADYVTTEGVVQESHIAQEDNPFGHETQDVDMGIKADPPYRYLIAAPTTPVGEPDHFPLEWETGYFPEEFRPEPGDRISAFGYWIHDCGHAGYHTEIHPPVGMVVDKQRAIFIPPVEGLGTNVYAPGIQSDIWFNYRSGGITDCGEAGLHQPNKTNEDNCVPAAPPFAGYSPLKRTYTFNIYLPQSPEDVLKALGKANPPHSKLYVSESFAPGMPTPALQFKQDEHGVGYLHGTIDLTNFNGTTYSGRINAAWESPSPTNWGLKQYQVKLNEIYVRDDSDVTNDTLGWGGDFHVWAVTNNQTEWTRILAGNSNEFDDTPDYFGGTPWSTHSNDSNRSLGSDVLLYPEQMIQFMPPATRTTALRRATVPGP